MNTRRNNIAVLLVVGLLMSSCEEAVKDVKGPKELVPEISLGTTIGSLVELFSADSIPVEGYGLVAGLNGTGSVECPPRIRAYLQQYILKQLPTDVLKPDEFISSLNTAVVLVEGIMPRAVGKNQYFDVRITALPGTQTTSLEGGRLYKTELKAAGGFGITIKVLARAEGPVFIDTINPKESNKRIGYILAGGSVLDEYKINLALRQPNYRIASMIRNKLNERFGEGTAEAISPSQIELKVPAKYKDQKQRFISIVKATYLAETTEITRERISTFVKKLAVSEDKDTYEAGLEAIGIDGVGKLGALLNSSNAEVRFRAARCMLNLGSDVGLEALREISSTKNSPYRIAALEAITAAGSRTDAATISRKLLRDDDFSIRLAAYEQLRKLDDISISRELISRDFFLEQITQTQHKGVFVTRSGQPRIVLFGAPLYCHENIFVQSPDGNITINAPSGQPYVSIIRKHPKRPNVILQLKSPYDVSDIIRKLCEEPLKKVGKGGVGLNVSYAEGIALLKEMCYKGALDAKFRAGPLPKIDLIIKIR
ncbi:MAG: flagellar basal body P-ring protein FlgI [Planctomycetota bacterium]|nr:MAG: flagellar basal body P-ring protein FlgI [Planctomycetota bacterium]